MLKLKKADFEQRYLSKVVDKVNRNRFEAGCSAYYVKLDKDIGLKFFYNKKNRDYTYKKHSEAHSVGVGPEVGSKVTFELQGKRLVSKKVYGYLIEHVDVAMIKWPKRGTEEWEDEGLLELEDRCIQNELPWPDLHSGNFGVNKKGQLVRIDFGDCDWALLI